MQLYACGVKQSTLLVTSSTAMNYCFSAESAESEISIGDGAILRYNEDGVAGYEQFTK